MKISRLILIGLIGWYCILISAHYFGQRPMWNDELCVYDNIVHLKPAALFHQPLLDYQEFPRFYLWCIQQFSLPLHGHLLALRLFPFLAMMTAFFVWLKVVRIQSQDIRALILFVGCWCASIPLVYHAGELKQYSMDVLCSGLFMLFLYRQPDLQKQPVLYRSLLFFMPLLGIFSYPVVFIYPLILYNLVRDAYAHRRLPPELFFYMAGGLGWVLFVYFFDYRVTLTGTLHTCWNDYFVSFNSMHVFLKSFGEGISNIIARWFAEIPRWFKYPARFFVGSGLLFMLINAWKVFKTEGYRFHSLMPAAFGIFFLHLLFGCLHKYPFGVPRTSLFIAPFLLWMTVLCLQWLKGKAKVIGTVVEVVFIVYLIFVSVGIARIVFACNPNLLHTGPGLGGQSELWQKGA